MSDENKVETVSKEDHERAIEKLRRLEAENTDFKKRFKDINPEEVKAYKEELELLRNEIAAGSGDTRKIEDRIKAAKEELRRELAREIENRDSLLKQKDSRIKELTVDSKVFSEAAGHFVPGFHNDLKRYIKEQCDIDNDGNIFVKDEKGEVRYSPANGGKHMSYQEFIDELKQTKEFAVVDRSIAGGKHSGDKKIGGSAITSLSQLAALSPEKQKEVLANMKDPEVAALFKNGR